MKSLFEQMGDTVKQAIISSPILPCRTQAIIRLVNTGVCAALI